MTIAKSKPPVHAPAATSTEPAAAGKPRAAAKTSSSPSPAAEVAKKSGNEAKKEKRVRSSFSMPESQFALIAELKTRCGAFGVTPRKSELLAAGLRALQNLSETSLEAEILPSLRTDRKGVKGKQRKK
jgi:hypothetical protein